MDKKGTIEYRISQLVAEGKEAFKKDNADNEKWFRNSIIPLVEPGKACREWVHKVGLFADESITDDYWYSSIKALTNYEKWENAIYSKLIKTLNAMIMQD